LRVVTTHTTEEPAIAIGELGETLSALRLCEPSAVEAMSESLARNGQLTPLIVFEQDGGLEIIDGFKRLRAARRLGWALLRVMRTETDRIAAKIHLTALHAGRGLTELEEGWVVRSLYREDRLSQGAIAERLGRHKSWVCRRLMLVEALESEVQACIRLGLLAPRAAVALAALPRGNQVAATEVVTRRALTVRQTELLVYQLNECGDEQARSALLSKWAHGDAIPSRPGPKPTRTVRSEADWAAADIATVHRVAARLEARLLAAPLRAFGATAAELLADSLTGLVPVLAALQRTISIVTTVGGNPVPPNHEQSAA
jgi:ParB/RepB/Spo0J family partition protein